MGDVKRVEKMCQRLELHFGPPGRPKKKVMMSGVGRKMLDENIEVCESCE